MVATNGVPTYVTSTSPNLGGNDTLYGGAGNDVIIGGAGADTIYGSSGDDVLLGDSGSVDLEQRGRLERHRFDRDRRGR